MRIGFFGTLSIDEGDVSAAPSLFHYQSASAFISSALNQFASTTSSAQVHCGSLIDLAFVLIYIYIYWELYVCVDAVLPCGEGKRALIFVKRLVRNYLQRRMWRHVDLLHLFISLVFITTFWCVVYAQGNANGPSNTSPEECIARRFWWTPMWGFIVTFIALTMDVWGTTKAMDKDTIKNAFATFCLSALNPLHYLWEVLERIFYGIAMVPNLREALGDVIVPMYPWSKSHIKIISGCDVIVNFSPNVYKENRYKLLAFKHTVEVEDLSEALVIGTKVANSKQCNVQLSNHGQLALLRSNVLPPYDELKILRGSSSLGMAIASAQAIGYIYGIVVRCVQGLQVSLIEAIACVLNLVILMKGVLHNFSSLGHRPLLLYLLPEEEAKFIEECKNISNFDFKTTNRFYLVVSFACGIVLAMGAYFIVNFLRSFNRISVVPIILFEVSLVLGGIQGFIWWNNYDCYLAFNLALSTVLLNLVGYVWALVVTFKYWKGEDFDVQSSNYLSQVLPYIG